MDNGPQNDERIFVGMDLEGTIALGDGAATMMDELSNNSGYGDVGLDFFKLIGDHVIEEWVAGTPGYSPGNPVGLVLPWAYSMGVSPNWMKKLAKKNVAAVPNISSTLEYLDRYCEAKIISTTYGQNMEVFCKVTGWNISNTFFTRFPRQMVIKKTEEKELIEFMISVTKMPHEKALIAIGTFIKKRLPILEAGRLLAVRPINQARKLIIANNLCNEYGILPKNKICVGDSITDDAMINNAALHGLGVATNATLSTLRRSNLSYIGSDPAGAIKKIICLFREGGRGYVLEECNPSLEVAEGFLAAVTAKNCEELGRASEQKRKLLRGAKIGSLP